MQKGDLVKVSESVHNPKTLFRIIEHGKWAENFRYVELPLLIDKTGIVTLVDGGDYCGVLHVAFGSTVVRAYHNYFTKFKKV
jgi:hypothetical protein